MIRGGPAMLDLDGAFSGPAQDALLRRHERYGSALANITGSDCIALDVMMPRSFRNSSALGLAAPHVQISAGIPQFDPQFYIRPTAALFPGPPPAVWVASDPFKTGPLQLLAAVRSGTRLQVQVHGDLGLVRPGKASRFDSIRYTIARRVLQAADTVRAVGETQARALIERFGLDRTRLFVAPVPIDRVFLEGPMAEHTEPLRVLFVGRIHPERGLDVWAKVAHAIARREPGMRFDIVGAGPSESDFRAQLSGLSHVTWHGELPPGEVARLMARANVLLSTPPTESYGRTLVEALCVGLPIVATETSGSQRVAAHQHVSISQDPEELAELALLSATMRISADNVEAFRREQESIDEESIRRLASSWIH